MQPKTTSNHLQRSLSFKTIKCGVELPNLKAELISYFTGTSDVYEKLFTVIKNNRSYYTKPEPLRHPLIFYYGHTAAFFVNKLIDKGLITERINESYERMFAVGVDEMDWDDLSESHYEWPSVEETKIYRNKVKQMVINIIQKTQQTQLNWNTDMWIILMGIEHERIHLETSSVIIRRLPIDQVQSLQWFKECPHSIKQLNKIPSNILKSVEAFEKEWDRQKETTQSYGWDNQFGHKHIKTKQFKASKMLVSNGEYYDFWVDNGYQKIKYWTQQGKNWLKSTKINKPVFWEIQQENAEEPQPNFYLRTITQVIEMPWDWPVEVNNLQAQAFCNWKGTRLNKNIRLPTEDEYLALRNTLDKNLNTWEHREVGNINLEYWLSPNPVNMFKTNGFYDIVGNVWQHTVTPLYPFEGFQIHPIYEDFTTPTFDNRHNIIKGGSFISTGNEALYHARYAFRRHFYQHAGFRYVESENETEVSSSEIDQSDDSVEKALRVHFVEESYIKEVLKYVGENYPTASQKKSLVVGCSVGRLPLQLSKKFSTSYGIDYTARYFQMATRLHEQKWLKYREIEIDLSKFEMSEQNFNKIQLIQMNPENTDKKKINQIDFMIIDGLSIRKNTLGKVLTNVMKLMSSEEEVQLLVITGSEQDEMALNKFIGNKSFSYDARQVSSGAEKQKLITLKGKIN